MEDSMGVSPAEESVSPSGGRMTKKDVIKRFSDEKWLSAVARAYFRAGEFSLVEIKFDLPRGVFDEIFIENPPLEERFSEVVRVEFNRIQKLSGLVRLNEALNTLVNQMNDMEDSSKAVSAAIALAKVQEKLLDMAEPQEEDDIDKLWEKIGENET